MTKHPDGGQSILVNGWETNYHDEGDGDPVILLHGSGPGVSAMANWRLVIPELSHHFRCIAPDLLGFGYSARPDDVSYVVDTWIDHVFGLADQLGLEQFSLIGNSMGGRIALGVADRYPERVLRMVLMGSAGPSMKPTEGLRALRSYTPSPENMRRLMEDVFAYDKSIVTDALVQARYEASAQPGAQETYWSIFHDERHSGSGLTPLTEEELRALATPTLIIHGRDDKVVPLENGLTLGRLLPNSQVHIFNRCGHWVQIEQVKAFNALSAWYLREG